MTENVNFASVYPKSFSIINCFSPSDIYNAGMYWATGDEEHREGRFEKGRGPGVVGTVLALTGKVSKPVATALTATDLVIGGLVEAGVIRESAISLFHDTVADGFDTAMEEGNVDRTDPEAIKGFMDANPGLGLKIAQDAARDTLIEAGAATLAGPMAEKLGDKMGLDEFGKAVTEQLLEKGIGMAGKKAKQDSEN